MTSSSKSIANGVNGRKSRGPRTKAGKMRSSRNARRHGLAAFQTNAEGAKLAKIEQMVDVICQGDDHAELRQQAALIAENQLWLSFIQAEKLAVLDRLRDPNAYSLHSGRRRARAKARLRLCNTASRRLQAIESLIERTKAAGRDPNNEPLPPALKGAWPPPWAPVAPGVERNEFERLREGSYELVRLLRYEQRALSRRKRAVRGFIAVKLTKHYQTEPT